MTTNMAINDYLLPNQDLWIKLDNPIVESILARLPVADLVCSEFVCRRWRKIIRSPTFQKAFTELYNRVPWFLMLNYHFPCNVVYDMEVTCWRHVCLSIHTDAGLSAVPLAASNSLMCCISEIGDVFVCNPLNGSARNIGVATGTLYCKAITMHAWRSSYTVCIIGWMPGCLYMRMFSSVYNGWTETTLEVFRLDRNHAQGNNLTKVDRVLFEQLVAPVLGINLDCIPSKALAGVTTVDSSGQLVVYYVDQSRHLVACYPSQKIAVIYPPLNVYCAIDLAECRGRILFLTLLEEHEMEVLRVWEFDHKQNDWVNITTMPVDMSKGFTGTNPQIDCSGCGDYIMICVSSMGYNFSKQVVFNIVENTWMELPLCVDPRCKLPKRLLSAFSFMPNIEDRV